MRQSIVLLLLAVAWPAYAFPYPLTVSLDPQSPGPDEEITAHVVFSEGASVGFAFGTTFAHVVSVQGTDIGLSIDVIAPPPIPPGAGTAPSFFLFEGSFSLGVLPVGSYTLDASILDGAEVIGSGSTTFMVVPEPTTALLLGVGLLGLAVARRRI